MIDFVLVYNMTSEFWSIATSGKFFGWVGVAAAVGGALTCAWFMVLSHRNEYFQSSVPSDVNEINVLFVRRYAPMAGLAIVMSSYFVGRSVDFTLIIAFLPSFVLFIPGFLWLLRTAKWERAHWNAQTALAGISCATVVLFSTFSLASVFRDGGPYKPLIGELVRADVAGISGRFDSRPMLDQQAHPNFEDFSGMAIEALTAIETYAPEQPRIILLLGKHPRTPWSVHSDMVLLLAERGHTYPISYVLSDELSSTRIKTIIRAEPVLDTGETIFVRTDENELGPLEREILSSLRRRYRFSRLANEGKFLSAYSVTGRR